MTTTINILRNASDAEEFEAGATIFTRGDAAESMYVVVEGEIEVLLDGEVIDRLGPGSVLGEMAIVDASPRSADARAGADGCRAVAIDRDRFTRLVARTPYFAL